MRARLLGGFALGSILSAAMVAAAMVAATSVSGCRRKVTAATDAGAKPASAASSAVVAAPALPPLKVERFLEAHALPEGRVRLAAVARDASIVLATLDDKLTPLSVDVLAKEFTADPATTEVALIGEDLVVAVGKLSTVRAPWLLRKGQPPKALPADWCRTQAGVAWVVRDPSSALVHFADKDGEKSAEPVAVPLEAEVHLACGPASAVLSVPDGPRLQVARVAPGKASALLELEKDGDLEGKTDGELRDRQVLVRDDESFVVVRLAEAAVHTREVKGATADKWTPRVDDKGKAFALDADADLLAAVAAPAGPAFLLVSSPMKGACASGDPPRRIVLHTLLAGGKTESRPVVELPCGVDAIPARLTLAPASGGAGSVAQLAWTEPLTTCNPVQVGLSIGALVLAGSDRPGARRVDFPAEAIVRVDATRFLGVVRPKGCVAYDAPDNGALAWVPAPK